MKRRYVAGLLLLGAIGAGSYVFAADHIDAPGATSEPTADITDVYAWMQSSTNLVLVMDVSGLMTPVASQTATFSDAVNYVFHVNSSAAYGGDQKEALIVCHFDPNAEVPTQLDVTCTLDGTQIVSGDASSTSGLGNTDENFKIFTGVRDDPFFFELDGFKNAVMTVDAVITSETPPTLDANGCPALTADQGTFLRGQLTHHTYTDAEINTPPQDKFAGTNVLSIVIELNKSLVNSNGPILGVWGSTHRR